MRRLDGSGLLKKLILIEPNPAKEDILLVHSKRHFETGPASGGILSTLEGGYNLNALARSAEAHMREMMG